MLDDPAMKIISQVFMCTLTVLATLILGSLNEVKVQSRSVVFEFQEYQKLMEKRVSRIEWKIWGDEGGRNNYNKTLNAK